MATKIYKDMAMLFLSKNYFDSLNFVFVLYLKFIFIPVIGWSKRKTAILGSSFCTKDLFFSSRTATLIKENVN